MFSSGPQGTAIVSIVTDQS